MSIERRRPLRTSARFGVVAPLLATACALVSNGEFDGFSAAPRGVAGAVGGTNLQGGSQNFAGSDNSGSGSASGEDAGGTAGDGGQIPEPAAGAGGLLSSTRGTGDTGGQLGSTGGLAGTGGENAGAVGAPRGALVPPSLISSKFEGWRPVPTTGLPKVTLLTSNPAAASSAQASVLLFARGIDGALWQTIGGTIDQGTTWAWHDWTSLGGPSDGALLGMASASAVNEESAQFAVAGRAMVGNTAQVFVRIYATPSGSETPSWTPWSQVSIGDLARDPAIIFNDGYLFVFAPGTNQEYYFTRNDISTGFDPSGWTPWQILPGGTFISEAGAAGLPGWEFIAALESDTHYYMNASASFGGDWRGWSRIDSGTLEFVSSPALTVSSNGQLNIFGTDASGALWNMTSTDRGVTWSTPQNISGLVLSSAPAAVSPADGVIHLFGRGPDDLIWMNPYRE